MILCLWLISSWLQPTVDPNALPEALVERIDERIQETYGAWGSCVEEPPLTRWGDTALSRCTYAVGERSAQVVVANPTSRQLSRWIVSACVHNDIAPLVTCAERLRAHIKRASDYQFPIAGVVLEDLDPSIEGVESYAFRDLVTVRVDGFVNGTAQHVTSLTQRAAETAQVLEVMRYARPVSATREDYRGFGGARWVGLSRDGHRAAGWLDVVREAHLEALTSDRHLLIDAWAASHRDLLAR